MSYKMYYTYLYKNQVSIIIPYIYDIFVLFNLVRGGPEGNVGGITPPRIRRIGS